MAKYRNKAKQFILISAIGLLTILTLGSLKAEASSTNPSAGLYLSPAALSVAPGSSLSIELRIKVTNDSTHSARVRLTYPADKLDLTSTAPSPAFFEADKAYSSGIINLSYGSLAGVTGDRLFATITFKVKTTSGEANVAIDPIIDPNNHSYVAGDMSGTGANILDSTANGVYSIASTINSSQIDPTVSGQTSQTPSNQPDISKATTNSSSMSRGASGTKTANSKVSDGLVSFEDHSPGPAAAASRTIVAVMALAVVTITFIAHYFNLHYKIVKLRQIDMRKKHETVADISSRLNGKDRSKDTVADMAARMKGRDHSKETVAELAVRVNRKTKKKIRKHSR